MAYTFPHFIRYRFALFNDVTKITGGAAAFDFFHHGYDSMIKLQRLTVDV